MHRRPWVRRPGHKTSTRNLLSGSDTRPGGPAGTRPVAAGRLAHDAAAQDHPERAVEHAEVATGVPVVDHGVGQSALLHPTEPQEGSGGPGGGPEGVAAGEPGLGQGADLGRDPAVELGGVSAGQYPDPASEAAAAVGPMAAVPASQRSRRSEGSRAATSGTADQKEERVGTSAMPSAAIRSSSDGSRC